MDDLTYIKTNMHGQQSPSDLCNLAGVECGWEVRVFWKSVSYQIRVMGSNHLAWRGAFQLEPGQNKIRILPSSHICKAFLSLHIPG
jgi:hypothetical protein